MCLADSGQQTTVVMVVAYTVPKRAIPVGAKAILALPEWNWSSIVPEWERGEAAGTNLPKLWSDCHNYVCLSRRCYRSHIGAAARIVATLCQGACGRKVAHGLSR